MGFVDLHSHVLFGLDDGSPNQVTSLAMLDGLAGLGVTRLCATPHQKHGQYFPSLDACRTTFAALQAAARPGHPALTLGAENMWDDVFYQRVQADEIPGYGGGPAFLFELQPRQPPVGLSEQLFKLCMAGKVPVMAHPERYEILWDDDDLARKWRQHCAFVVDLGALAGYHGKRESKAARHLVESGLAHAVASDAHHPGDVQQARDGLAWIEKKLGAAAVERLYSEAPATVLRGDLPDD